MGRHFEVRAASMAKTAAAKTKVYSRYGKEIYLAAKNGVPDPEMNVVLKRVIAQAKSNQVPTDVINRAIDKAKGGTGENYDSVRYEGFGPGAATIIVDCLTDNVNRSIGDVRTCFNKAHCKLGVSGSVSFMYDHCGYFVFETQTDEEALLEHLLESEIDVIELEKDGDTVEIQVPVNQFHETKESLEQLLGSELEYEVCELSMLPQDMVELESEEDKEAFTKLITLLEDVDDVQNVYHNVSNLD